MYNARFISDSGKIFDFGFQHGTLFDITPLSGVQVNVKTSQGFQKYGATIESRSVSGIERTISGKILRNINMIKYSMLQVFTPMTSGKLYFGEKYYCNCVVKSTPTVGGKEETGAPFFISIYCASPFWLSATQNSFILGGYTPAFRFPVNYSKPHTFGNKNPNAFVNCINRGVAETPFQIRFIAETAVQNYGIIDAETLEFLKINDTLKIGEEVNVYRKNNKLYIEKTKDGKITSIFTKLDEDSTLFMLKIGDNLIKTTSDSNVDGLVATVVFNESYSGVYDGM